MENLNILSLQKQLTKKSLDSKFYFDANMILEQCKHIDFDSKKELDDFVKNRFNREDYLEDIITDDEYIDVQNDIVDVISTFYNVQ